MTRKLVGGLHRALRGSPVVFALLCALVLVSFSFYSSETLHFRHQGGGLRVTDTHNLAQIYDPETLHLSATQRYPKAIPEDSERSLRELVKDAVDRGLVVIVNASDADAGHVLADHSQGARLDISGALDGPMGEILVEVMQELRNMEEMKHEVGALKHKLKQYEDKGKGSDLNPNTPVLGVLRHGEHGFRPVGRPLHPLVMFSAFRFDIDEFTAVAVASPSLLPNTFFDLDNSSCAWVEWDASSPSGFASPSSDGPRVQRGEKRIVRLDNDATSPGYVAVVIRCKFADPAGSNGYGGHLFLNLDDDDPVALLVEPPESIDKIQLEGELQHRFAVCTPPIWNPLNATHLKEWIMYHHHILGSDRLHYFFYTGTDQDSLDEPTLHVLQPLFDLKMATIIDLSPAANLLGAQSRFPFTLLARNDCVQRSRFFADWAFVLDFNEFLQTFPPHETVPAIVAANEDSPYIAFGSQRWSSHYCVRVDDGSDGSSPWATDRMQFRLKLPLCTGEKNTTIPCPGGEGKRRFVVNPKRVRAVHNYYTVDPSWGGVDLSTDLVRVNHYLGHLGEGQDPLCGITKEPREVDPVVPVDGFWFLDSSFANSSRAAHGLAKSSPLFNTEEKLNKLNRLLN